MSGSSSCNSPISKRSGWVMGTEMVVLPVAAVPESAPVPVICTPMLATPLVKLAEGSTEKLTCRVLLGDMPPT